MSKEITLGTLYDFNKTIMLQQGKITKAQLKKAIEELEEWFNWQIDNYAILLCRERYDFTIFHLYETENLNPPKVAAQELIAVLKNRGTILSIERDSEKINNAWEIWLEIDGEAYAYYLFNCDDWTIEC